MPNKTNPPFVPHVSGQVAAIMGVVGTLGTSDTAGTAQVLPVGVNPVNGALYNQNLAGLSMPPYDYVSLGTTNGSTDVWTFKTGGSAGGTVNVITIIYTDAGKGTISTVTKT